MSPDPLRRRQEQAIFDGSAVADDGQLEAVDEQIGGVEIISHQNPLFVANRHNS